MKIAAHHLNKRGGVLIGDVVGLGKTVMALALARIFEDNYDSDTLFICPKNLVPMWEDYQERYRLRGRILPTSMVSQMLPDLRRYRLVLIDESHNLRNREGKRYKAIRDYIEKNESKVILLSAPDTLQQAVRRPLKPTAPLHSRGCQPGDFGLNTCYGR